MIRTISLLKEKLQRVPGSPDDGQRGQVLVIVAVGVFVLLILVGLAVDLGLYFIERVRIARAVDAATLAAAYELPFEEAAHLQALDYLQQNGYDFQLPETALYIDGNLSAAASSGVTKTAIYLDTAMFRDTPDDDASAFRIQVRVTQIVPVIFLRFAGFDNLPCEAVSVAENINNLDVTIVFDQSGSMEFNTLCYGCWDKVSGVDYRGGDIYPLPWEGAADWDLGESNPPEHCGPTEYLSDDGYDYYFIEAEEYSYSSNPYYKGVQRLGYTYWVLQRTGSAWSRYTYASGRDSRMGEGDGGAYIMHMPYPDMEEGGPGATCRYEEVAADGNCWSGAPGGPYPAPRVDYNFAPIENRTGYYIWVRGQAIRGGYGWDRSDGWDRRLFWGIDGVLGGSEGRKDYNCDMVGCVGGFSRGTGYDGASSNWQWRRLNDNGAIFWPEGENHTLNIWAGGAEFALDRILITNDPHGYDYLDPLHENSGRGRQVWANGRAGWACDRCDARFAGYPARASELSDPSDVVSYFPICDNPDLDPSAQDRRTDDIYDDEQPVRGSVEAAKMFVGLLNPRFDQVGYVSYSSNANIDSHLQCLRRLGETCDATVITNTVIHELDTTYAGGGTNIAEGMELGLDALRTGSRSDCVDGTGPCGRPGANHVMIVMTDGVANQVPNNYCDDDPERQWEPLDGSTGSAAQDCVIYYAYEALHRNVIVYTITLGGSADSDLMSAVADITGGVYRHADNPGELDKIFDELYDLMFLRLVK